MTLNDGMSSVLKKITRALDTTLHTFEAVQAASGQAMDTALIRAAHTELAQANAEIDRMEAGFREAEQRERRLNASLNNGTNAAGQLLGKITSMVAAYASLSAIKGFVTDSLEAADVQIGAQVQLRTVLENMDATVSGYGTGEVIEDTLTLDTDPALAAYDAALAYYGDGTVEETLTMDTSGAEAAYDAIVQKAADIQSRGIYGDEAMIAGAAELATYFSDADAILSMMDTLSNYAMGMSGGGEVNSEAMVDYATGIGKIMSGSYDAMTKKGFEFSDSQKAIIEGTATQSEIVQELGEDYLSMSQEMQAAAVIGSIIDEGWAGLYETMSNTPEGQIIQFNNALGDIKEMAGAGIYPAVLNFMNLFRENLPQIQNLTMGFVSVLGYLLGILTGITTAAVNFGSAVMENWSWLGPIVMGVVTALLAYHGALLAINIAEGIHNGLEVMSAASAAWKSGATLAEAAATTTATGAQVGLNAALLACPITWIVVAVIALIAGIVALCNWIAKTTGVAQTGFGVITGGINVAIQAVINAGMVVANVALGIWNAMGAVCSNIGTAFHNVIANVQGWFFGLLSTALTVVAGICEALNKLPFVEFDYSGITGKADEFAAKSAEAYGNTEDYTSVGDAFSEGFGTFDAFSEGWASDAFQAGAAWGDGVADKVGGLFSYEPGSIDDYTQNAMAGAGFTLDDMAGDVGDIAGNTGSMADSMEVSQEELAYLRDIAERDAINRFTTAEVSIDMTGMTNRIEGEADLDGVITQLTEGFTDALLTAAEGVHA